MMIDLKSNLLSITLVYNEKRKNTYRTITVNGFNKFSDTNIIIAESAARVYAKRHKIRGLTMVYEPKYLRFFQAKFERIGPAL